MSTCEYSKYSVDALVFPADAILKKSENSAEMRELYFTWIKEVVKKCPKRRAVYRNFR